MALKGKIRSEGYSSLESRSELTRELNQCRGRTQFLLYETIAEIEIAVRPA